MKPSRPNIETASVSATFAMCFAGSDEDGIKATLAYDVLEPFAVTASFVLPDSPAVRWVMARDLLREGVVMPSGIGDIKLCPSGNRLYIELTSPSGTAVLEAPIAPVIDFVNRMYKAVPEDREQDYFSVDAELDLLSALYTQPESGLEA